VPPIAPPVDGATAGRRVISVGGFGVRDGCFKFASARERVVAVTVAVDLRAGVFACGGIVFCVFFGRRATGARNTPPTAAPAIDAPAAPRDRRVRRGGGRPGMTVLSVGCRRLPAAPPVTTFTGRP
jgi:hypothetical protein